MRRTLAILVTSTLMPKPATSLSRASTTSSRAAAGPSLRERGKTDKGRRIREAAREVFIERGYEEATTREIAARADVSIGTVFVYARDKRDLLLLIVNDELDAVSVKGRAVMKQPGTLLERLLAFFRLRYVYWSKEPRLARPALRETFDFLEPDVKHGEETRRFYHRRPMVMADIEQMILDAQSAGEVAADVPAAELASLIFNIYLIEARRWLSADSPRASKGIERLGVVLGLVLRGALTSKSGG
jgi:AcrR family transcriptional regulator